MPIGGTQNIALTHRAVLEVKNSGSIGREVGRMKDGTIRKMLAAGKRKRERKANGRETTVDEREFPYPSCGERCHGTASKPRGLITRYRTTIFDLQSSITHRHELPTDLFEGKKGYQRQL